MSRDLTRLFTSCHCLEMVHPHPPTPPKMHLTVYVQPVHLIANKVKTSVVFMSPLSSHDMGNGAYQKAVFRNPPRHHKPSQRRSSEDDVQTLAPISEQTSPERRLEPLREETVLSTKQAPRRSSIGLSSQRSKRATASTVKSYAEPSIHTKLRQGDDFTIPKEDPYARPRLGKR